MKLSSTILVQAFLILLVTNGCKNAWLKDDRYSQYRTGSPSNAILGTYGIRTKASLTKHKFDRYSDLAGDFEIVTPAPITYNETKFKRVKSQIQSMGIFDDSVLVNLTASTSSRYRIHEIQVKSNEDIRSRIDSLLNADTTNAFAGNIGIPDARVITGILAVYDHRKVLGLDGDFRYSKGKSAKIEFITKNGETIEMGDGTVVAFRMARICWDKKNCTPATVTTDEPGYDKKVCEKKYRANLERICE
ncbi:MAG: hypothetical protein NXI20_03165 [bacterium]|nr:hypothetical protein [bacterium]